MPPLRQVNDLLRTEDNASDGAKSQLLFIDETVMTIGSDTKLTIDDFIFDPSANDGKLFATIIAGSVKILSGKISEKNPANLEVKIPFLNYQCKLIY